MVVGGFREPEIVFAPVRGGHTILRGQSRGALGRNVRRKYDESAVHTHFNLQIALCTAVVGARAGRGGGEGIGHAATISDFRCEESLRRGRAST